MDQIVSEQNATGTGGKIFSLAWYKESQKTDWQERFFQSCYETHGKEYTDDCKQNPYLRLLLKYDGLSEKSKSKMFSFVESYMAEKKGRVLNKRDILEDFLSWGNREIWGEIEDFTDRLFVREGIHQASGRKQEWVGGVI